MPKMFLIIASSMLLLNCLVSQAQTRSTSTDDTVPTYEVGGQFFGSGSRELGYGAGAGGRFTYNLNKYLASDNEVNFFLSDEGGSYATQGLFGVKAGARTKRLGFFAKARPGFQTNFVVNSREQARFAMDVGGVAEFYPNRHVVLRFDAGDLIIPFGNEGVGFGTQAQRFGTSHNLQIELGLAIRF